MKARFKRGWWRTYGTLTPGNVYRVIGIEADQLRIFDDLGDPVLFVPQAFDVVDPTEPSDWMSTHGDDGERYAYPVELAEPGFFEDWHDGDVRARSWLAGYVREISWSEANALEDAANMYLRVQRNHAANDAPTLLYSELDEKNTSPSSNASRVRCPHALYSSSSSRSISRSATATSSFTMSVRYLSRSE